MQKDEIRDRLIGLIEGAYFCSIEELADHIIANGVTMQAWVYDADGVPEVDPETGYVEVAVFTKDRKIKTAIWDGENYYGEAHTIDDLDAVVAYWTYLPPRPKGVE